MESKAKLGVIGRVSVNIAEIVSAMESDVERKLPLNLHFGGVSIEANLLVIENSLCFSLFPFSLTQPNMVLWDC